MFTSRITNISVLLCTFLLLIAIAVSNTAQATAKPKLQAKAAIVIEASTGLVLYKKNAQQRRAIASTTKIMTALLTAERASLATTYSGVRYPTTGAESIIGLQPGEQMTVADLLRGLLLASGNDAAATLATGVSGSTSAFVKAMNQRARQLKLRHTQYSTPVGLDNPKNYSSAADLATLTRTVLQNSFLRKTVNLPSATLRFGKKKRRIFNRNTLVRNVSWVNGVKTGHTNKAGYALVASGTRKGLTFIAVVLGTPNEAVRDREALELLKYGISHTTEQHILQKSESLAQTTVRFQPKRRIPIVPANDFTQILRKGDKVQVKITELEKNIEGPRSTGSPAGKATVFVNGRPAKEVTLLTATTIPKATIQQKLEAVFKKRFVRILLAIFIISMAGFLFLIYSIKRQKRSFRSRPVPR